MSDENTTPAKLVYEAMINVHSLRSEYWHQIHQGRISHRLHSDLQSATMDYYDELKRYRGRVKKKWREAQLDRLPEIVARKRTITKTEKQGGIMTQTTESYPSRIAVNQIVQITYDLDDIATDLGFAIENNPPVADPDEAIV